MFESCLRNSKAQQKLGFLCLLRQDPSHAPGRSSSQSEASLWAERESCLRNYDWVTSIKRQVTQFFVSPLTQN